MRICAHAQSAFRDYTTQGLAHNIVIKAKNISAVFKKQK